MASPSVVRRRAGGLMAGWSRGYHAAVTRGRWAVVLFWVVAATLVTVLVPPAGPTTNDFGDLLPDDSPVLAVQHRSLEQFRVPVVSGTTVVLHDPDGLSLLTRADSVLWALAITQQAAQDANPPRDRLIGAVPLPTGTADTTVTYLYASETTGVWQTVQLANAYAAHFNNQATARAYVTGSLPAQIAQGGYLEARLPLFEAASVVLILLVVALAFRSLLAPLVVVGIAGVGYVVYFPLLSQLARTFGFEVPSQLEPVLLALLLGVVTDYCVLLFAAFRDELDSDPRSVPSAQRALADNASVIAVAGLTVAGGTLALLAAPFGIFRALAPALALTVLVGVAICLTLTPAVMTILGWRLFTVLPVRGSARADQLVEHVPKHPRDPAKWITLLTRRGPALVAATVVLLLLALGTVPLAQTKLDLSFTAALPDADSAAEGAAVLSSIGLEGMTAPTEVLVEQQGVTNKREQLARLQGLIARERGVAKVLGPADTPLAAAQGLVLATSENAARFIVIYNSDPLAAKAIADVRDLQRRVSTLASVADLPDAEIAVTGQTLIAGEVADLTRESLQITLLVAIAIELIILGLYLRALLAPVVLLFCSALSVAAALGLTTWLFQDVLGDQGLTFYAPFAAAVLLIALGSDYNVFAVGAIWNEAKRRPLREAMIVAVPRTAHAITVAGAILAGTFALVAIIPLSTFRQIAFAMTVGLVIDTLVIRPVLTPAVLTLMGPRASWPSRRLR